MTVICLTNCPPKLRGDLTKWLIEINTGVFVGNISARVREELWDRIKDNIRSGQATMVYRSAGEQHMDFQVHNTTWKPVDYDGLKLIKRPKNSSTTGEEDRRFTDGFSKASRMKKTRQMQHASAVRTNMSSYTVLDLGTTGLNREKDKIIEIAALRVYSGKVIEEFNCLVQPSCEVKHEIQTLTGITEEMLEKAGLPLRQALESLITFLGNDRLVCWNAPFDLAFLQLECSRSGLPVPRNKVEDAMKLARRTITELPDYRLITVAQYYGIDTSGLHRALNDCFLTHAVFVHFALTSGHWCVCQRTLGAMNGQT